MLKKLSLIALILTLPVLADFYSRKEPGSDYKSYGRARYSFFEDKVENISPEEQQEFIAFQEKVNEIGTKARKELEELFDQHEALFKKIIDPAGNLLAKFEIEFPY
jgi:hypothetical protein